MSEVGEHGETADAMHRWDIAQRNLADAEIAVIAWELKSSEPTPQALLAAVQKCREAVAFFEEWALVHLSDGWRERKPVDVYHFGVRDGIGT